MHVFGQVYGWTYDDVVRLSPATINAHLALIERDNLARQRQVRAARRR